MQARPDEKKALQPAIPTFSDDDAIRAQKIINLADRKAKELMGLVRDRVAEGNMLAARRVFAEAQQWQAIVRGQGGSAPESTGFQAD